MSEKKEPIGFHTPASKLQKGFDEISARLKKDKPDWGAITKDLSFIQPTVLQVVAKIHKEAEEAKDLQGMTFAFQPLVNFTTLHCVATLGKDLTALHESVANIEQSIAKLALRLK